MNLIKNSLDTLLLAIFPKRCLFCGQVIEPEEDYCEECKRVKKIEAPVCFHCGASKNDCVCKKHKHEYKRIIAPYYFEGSIPKAVYNFKFNKHKYLASSFAKEMSKTISELYNDVTFDFITFVPMRRLHQFERGFNQSELLSDEISKLLDIPVKSVLYKSRYTGVQHNKSAKARRADIFGSFNVYKDSFDLVDGKTILLIDDIKTTGATLNECAKMLNIYGAKDVYACTFAVSKSKSKDE
ncbi:MAG: ComF family protein [Eubacterium sp.]|nr:ComF family protein [Eubacterium sp.]